MQKTQPDIGRAAIAVLALLKREGPISADSLAEMVGLTSMAVRLHLASLSTADLARHEDEARPRGRPVQMWSATAKADAYFADSHAALTADLIVQMKKAFGEDGMDKILKLRTAEQEKSYREQVDAKHLLKSKLDALAKIREREGYMAEVRRDPDAQAWLLIENHCPICVAARACQGICREELALFRRVLGAGVKVERVSHILAGATRCAYRVTPA